MLRAVPLTRDHANAFVESQHRHNGRVVSHRFAIGAVDRGQLVGVAIVGNTKARALQDRYVAEIVRVCTDGSPNACSFLYARCWQIWRLMGGERIVTYTLDTEPGTSLVAAGFQRVGKVRGREHDTPSRRRTHKGGAQLVNKWRWEKAV